ncbi:MAG: lipoyl(octanoyl) transferase [Myxococcota bacterium]|jgi:lipoyl(octanoyl) transferase
MSPVANNIDVRFEGEVAYRTALDVQRRSRDDVLAGAPDRLHLLTHPPTITIGRHGNPANVLRPDGCEVVQVDRGGDVTFHGPGQLVGYPIVHLARRRLGVRNYVERLAAGLKQVLETIGISSEWDGDIPGLWVGSAKIAAFGVHVHRQVTTHGFALNVDPDLGWFERIVPCGLADRHVTSITALTGQSSLIEDLWPKIGVAISDALNV